MPKVSIIMPCLNVAKYIDQCINSVIHQTLKDIEIIIIDAGSSDGTLEIIDTYKKRDPRINVIFSSKKSYGYQINQGILSAEGEYIGIVETDDYIQGDMFEVLYEKAIETKADYVKGTNEAFYQGINGMEWKFPIIPCRELETESEYRAIPRNNPDLFLYDNFIWNGIYRKDFMRTIRLSETNGAAFQDIGALFQIISTAEKGVYIKHLVYHYRQDNFGASSYNKKGFLYAANEYKYLESYLDNLSEEWHRVYYLKMAGLCIDRFYFMARSGEFWNESVLGIQKLHEKISKGVETMMIRECECDSWQNELWERICIFLKNPVELYERIKDIYEKRWDVLRKITDIACQRRIYIFGAGDLGQFLHMYLELQGIRNVIAYCDNNEKVQGEIIQNLPVLSLNDAFGEEPEAYYIIAVKSDRNRMEMRKQLLQIGVRDENIGIYELVIDMYLLK